VYSHAIAILTLLVPHTPRTPRLSVLGFIVRNIICGHILDLEEDVEIVLGLLSERWPASSIVGDYYDSADVLDT
jgi:hypothetical protein